MSEELQKKIDALSAENTAMKNQAQQNGIGINGLLAQVDGAKQQINELMTASLNLRANCILLQKQNKELNDALTEANKKVEVANRQLEDVKKQLLEANAKIAEPAAPVEG